MHYVGLGFFTYLVASNGREYGSSNYIGFRRFAYWTSVTPFRMITSVVPFFIALLVHRMILGLYYFTHLGKC